ncbi:hypothetical protein KR054_002016 [Drosophila jambulina]|nr:hypothetical protein KR054_002016 [Drosophila jambulina]
MGAADYVNNEIKELLQNGIIRPSRSPYNSPAWVVDKKGTDDNGSKKKRLVIDFRKLNERTIADRYPMPSIPMILANLGKAKFFTTLDLKSGYHQIYLAEKDLEKTSFSVNGGKYEFCRLPFGLKNAGSIFQRAIDDVLREDIGKICYVYVDDVIIFSENETEHVKHIDTVLKRLLDASRVAREKTKFFKESVEFLGLAIISIILLSTASARITDFSHAKYILVLDGNVLVWEQYGLVRHSTNLSEFASIIDSAVRMLELFPHSHMRKLLEVDIEHAQNLLEELKIHHRMARNLDFLGSVLKVVAGVSRHLRQAITCRRAATCRTRPSNLEPLTIVDDGVIIVNEKLTRITVDDGPTTTIEGTHLITFERMAVINDSVYLNLNYSVNKSPGIAASPLINITGHDHILSLKMLQRMNEHNLRSMQELRDDVSAGGSPRIWFAAGVAVSLTLCGSAQDLLLQTANEQNIDVAILSEPYRPKPEGVWQQSGYGGAAICSCGQPPGHLAQRTSRPGYARAKLQATTIYSCYLAPSLPIDEFREIVQEIAQDARGRSPVIIAGDFNAWSTAWGSTRTTQRGTIILDALSTLDVCLLNDGRKCTYSKAGRESFIDLTFASPQLTRNSYWEVTQLLTYSDHAAIFFHTRQSQPHQTSRETAYRVHTLNTEVLLSCMNANTITGEANTCADAMSDRIKAACDAAMEKSTKGGGRRPVPWWNQDIALPRSECLAARRRCQRSRGRTTQELYESRYR